MSGMSNMAGMTMTGASMTMPMASSTSGAAMAGMTGAAVKGHGMDMGEQLGCKISMLWNWYTIDACFLSSGWRIRSSGMFAGSLIGVMLLVILLEGLRRAAKEYDHHILNTWKDDMSRQARGKPVMEDSPMSTGTSTNDGSKRMSRAFAKLRQGSSHAMFRPTLVQQCVRAAFHMIQFAVAYMIMLLAMYYNGYLIICIFIGAYIGFFIFGWEAVAVELLAPPEEATACCG